MLARLGRVAWEARRAAGETQLDIALAAGVSQNVISRFENGHRWPRDPDRIVAAYQDECDLDADELWRRAIENRPPEGT